MNTFQTLRDKETALRASVGMPTADDWQLYATCETEVVIEAANAVLLKMLDRLRTFTQKYPSLARSHRLIVPALSEIEVG